MYDWPLAVSTQQATHNFHYHLKIITYLPKYHAYALDLFTTDINIDNEFDNEFDHVMMDGHWLHLGRAFVHQPGSRILNILVANAGLPNFINDYVPVIRSIR